MKPKTFKKADCERKKPKEKIECPPEKRLFLKHYFMYMASKKNSQQNYDKSNSTKGTMDI